MPPITVRSAASPNTLFYGDNLPILADYIDDESVDLVYLDPPFNSNRRTGVRRQEIGSKGRQVRKARARGSTA